MLAVPVRDTFSTVVASPTLLAPACIWHHAKTLLQNKLEVLAFTVKDCVILEEDIVLEVIFGIAILMI